jgi:chromosome segregation ATPase
MRKFGAFLARKPAVSDIPFEVVPAAATPADNPLELDEELFSAIGAQVGGENEALRSLLLDANAKVGELDIIKDAVGRLVDPVSKALRAIEAEKSERAALQTVLSNTRTAYGKLRNEAAELERKLADSEHRCGEFRQELANTQALLRAAEVTRAEIAIDVAARRAQIADLEAQLSQQIGDNKALNDENSRLDERLTTAEKRIIALESDLNGARQRLLISEDEKRAQQAMLDKAGAEAARLSRKLSETEASLNASQNRLRHVEGNFAELNTERARLARALEEANERSEHERATQHSRFESLQARVAATDRLLGEARGHLLARAEEIRDYDRRMSELALERDTLQTRLTDIESERLHQNSLVQELTQTRSSLLERGGALTRAFTAKEAALERAEDTIGALNERIGTLEQVLAADRQTHADSVEELSVALRREKLERAVTEGALETARTDLARVMRDVMALQRHQQAQEPPPQPRAANAA